MTNPQGKAIKSNTSRAGNGAAEAHIEISPSQGFFDTKKDQRKLVFIVSEGGPVNMTSAPFK